MCLTFVQSEIGQCMEAKMTTNKTAGMRTRTT